MTAAMTMAVSAGSCALTAHIVETGDTSSDIASLVAEDVTEKETEAVTEAATESSTSPEADSDLFSKRDLDPSYNEVTAEISLEGSTASVDGKGAEVSGSTVTVKEEGVYLISGSLSDGQIVVEADKAKVQLVLNDADITCKSGPAILGSSSDKIFITLAEGSYNRLIGGTAEGEACISSSDSLTINGSGDLDLMSEADGIHSKDDIVITGGTVIIDAKGDGIKGKDYVAAADGTVSITAGQDGIKASNETDEGKGFVYIQGGSFTIGSENDGIQAYSDVTVKNGTIDIVSGGGSGNSTKKHNDFGGGNPGGGFGGNFGGDFGSWGDFDPSQFGDMTLPEGWGDFDYSQFGDMMPPEGWGDFGNWQFPDGRSGATEKDDSSAEPLSYLAPSGAKDKEEESAEDTSSDSTKGIKAGGIYISGGSITINSADDALHSDGALDISGGDTSIESGDDGIHAEEGISISAGTVMIKDSYEGIEAAKISISGGSVSVKSSDDGFNASDGTEQGGMGRYSESAAIDISGGFVYVDAEGDGLDSNGDLTISDGTVIVNGPQNGGNGALDSNGEITVNGGLLIAAGSSGMAEFPGDKSEQYSVSAAFDSTLSGGTLVTLTDNSGKELLSFAPAKTFSHIVISSPHITKGETYRIYTGGSTSAESDDFGLSYEGYKNDGTEAGSFTADTPTSFIGSKTGGFGGFGGGRPGGRDGQDFQPPTDGNGEIQMPEGGFGRGRRSRPQDSGADQ